MKAFILFAVLCAVMAAASISASPLAGRHHHQLRYRPQSFARQAALTQMQRRSWQPFRPSKWAMRRSSDEQPIEQPIAAPEDAIEFEPLNAAAADLELTAEQPAIDAPADDEEDTVAADEPIASVPSFPPHTFFPMNFGAMNGASLAVANGFSTGKGDAYSHAIAHGASRST